MLAFGFHLNGKKVCTAGLDEPGVVASTLTWVRGVPAKGGTPQADELGLVVGGLRSRTGTHVTWLARQLGKGDSVRIDVVDARKADRPKSKKSENARTRRKREQRYVGEKAAAWGWKIKK